METEIKDFRERWQEENPDKFIKIDKWGGQGYATHYVYCTWSPNCTTKDLVDYADNGTGNFGGRLENVKENEDGTESGTVVVYFD